MNSSIALACLAAMAGASEFVPPERVPVAVPNGGFESSLAGVWEIRAMGARFVGRDEGEAYSGRASVRLSCTRKGTRIELAPSHMLRVRAGETYKVAVFARTAGATGDTFVSLEGYREMRHVGTLGRSRPLGGTTPGWVYLWAVGDVPADGSVTHLQVSLCSDDNAGSVWFDDVALYRLPPDKPLVTGVPPGPPHGQITVRDGHLVGSGGRRVRLWGINCPDEPNRTYREMTFIARRIKQMGFNAVRMHIYDFRFIDTEAVNGRGERMSVVFRKSRRGDGSLLDKLDYFIYCCEREGLYVYMTFDRLSPQSAFGPGDYDVLPAESDEDRRAWQQALGQLQAGGCDEHAYYVDPRLGEAQARFVRQVLDHRNAYTGRRVADDPYVALYELTNENHFPEWALQGGFRKWPQYFQDVMQKRWNAWLRERYGSDERLMQAWGRLEDGESLAAGSVRVAPVLSEASQYPQERLADVHRFIYDLFVGYSKRLERIIREAGECSTRTPVSWDTLHEHKHKWYYPCSLADLMTVGVYVRGPAQPDRESRRIGTGFRAIYNLSFATVLGKATVVYETNTLKPDYWRADYPVLISAFASTHDWDGVFWYAWADGTVPDEFDADTYWATGLRYAASSHRWHGIVTSTDEVLLASLRLGGAMFIRRAIPATPEPVVLTVGAEDLL
ncbi:MAG: beta-galactosidase, partial [Armatimonadetes bacterium]|nr:beta-galactosidase [Armatimonadota bacterium]